MITVRVANFWNDDTVPAKPRSSKPRREPAPPRRESTLRFPHRGVSPAPRASRLGRFLRGLSGTLTGGAVALAAALIVVQVWSSNLGQRGPGLVVVIAHVLVAVLAVVLQVVADRRADGTGNAALAGVLAVVLGSLWFWWWA